MNSLKFIAGAAAAIALSACASAAPAKSYIASAHLDATKFLAKPPEATSDAQKADMAVVKADQAMKDTPRWDLAKHDDETSVYSAFGSALGESFTKAKTPKLAALFDTLFADVKTITDPSKVAFDRPRPPLIDTSITPCMPLEKSKSYPSGHATRGWMMALMLSDMIPEKANELLARGRDYGDSRIVCAEHYPSDVQAGRLIGAAVFAAAKDNAAFKHDYAAARWQTRRALGLH